MSRIIPKEAVVVVHGIGEQRPFSTLTGFVGAGGLLGSDEWVVGRDAFSDRLDLRRIATRLTNFSGDAPDKTWHHWVQFYEYYWAYRFRDTTMSHLGSWVRNLLLRSRAGITQTRLTGPQGRWGCTGRVFVALLLGVFALALYNPPDVRGPVLLVSGVGALALALASFLGVFTFVHCLVVCGLLVAGAVLWPVTDSWGGIAGVAPMAGTGLVALALGVIWSSWGPRIPRWAQYVLLVPGALIYLGSAGAALLQGNEATRSAVLSLLVTSATGVITGLVLRSVGDAARYLNDEPGNVEERDAVRRGLVDILRKLHTAKDPDTGNHVYDRVVVVGHSLGSVIAYDAVCALWSELQDTIELPDPGSPNEPTNAALESLEEQGAATPTDPGWRVEFLRSQWRLGRALASDLRVETQEDPPGSRWIISDLVTIGSPLTYAELLLAEGQEDLEFRKERRLLMTCPPVQRTGTGSDSRPLRYRKYLGEPGSYAYRLHSAAAFAATRWTNVYFDNDPVGGPLAPFFGPGVLDFQAHRASGNVEVLPVNEEMPKTWPHPCRWLGWSHSKYWKTDTAYSRRAAGILRHIILAPESPALDNATEGVQAPRGLGSDPKRRQEVIITYGAKDRDAVLQAVSQLPAVDIPCRESLAIRLRERAKKGKDKTGRVWHWRFVGTCLALNQVEALRGQLRDGGARNATVVRVGHPGSGSVPVPDPDAGQGEDAVVDR